MSATEPTGTPVRLTGAPACSPPARAKWMSYWIFRSQNRCWEPSRKTVAMKSTSATATSNPTLTVCTPVLRGRQELVEMGIARGARLVRRSREADQPLVEEGDAVGNEEGAGEVVGHHHGGETEAVLEGAEQ